MIDFRYTYNLLVWRYCRVDDFDGAFRILKCMTADGLFANEETYNCARNGICESWKREIF